jgi:hypothetical protein
MSYELHSTIILSKICLSFWSATYGSPHGLKNFGISTTRNPCSPTLPAFGTRGQSLSQGPVGPGGPPLPGLAARPMVRFNFPALSAASARRDSWRLVAALVDRDGKARPGKAARVRQACQTSGDRDQVSCRTSHAASSCREGAGHPLSRPASARQAGPAQPCPCWQRRTAFGPGSGRLFIIALNSRLPPPSVHPNLEIDTLHPWPPCECSIMTVAQKIRDYSRSPEGTTSRIAPGPRV